MTEGSFHSTKSGVMYDGSGFVLFTTRSTELSGDGGIDERQRNTVVWNRLFDVVLIQIVPVGWGGRLNGCWDVPGGSRFDVV